MFPSVLVTAGSALIGLLGLAHMILTLRGPKLLPRDRSVREAMRATAPVITTQTDLWRMWIGFHLSHSMGAMLFGLVYAHLALRHPEVLFGSPFLQAVGLAMVGGFTVLARRYWFITPLVGSALALLLYTAGLLMARMA